MACTTDDRATVERLAADINARLSHDVEATVTASTEALYTSMPDRALFTLRCAFALDRARQPSARTVAFCSSRIELITRILRQRRGGQTS